MQMERSRLKTRNKSKDSIIMCCWDGGWDPGTSPPPFFLGKWFSGGESLRQPGKSSIVRIGKGSNWSFYLGDKHLPGFEGGKHLKPGKVIKGQPLSLRPIRGLLLRT